MYTPYSLGKLIDWKLGFGAGGRIPNRTPYSLGKLIDWKRKVAHNKSSDPMPPYSLGKLIDWKPVPRFSRQIFTTNIEILPTR